MTTTTLHDVHHARAAAASVCQARAVAASVGRPLHERDETAVLDGLARLAALVERHRPGGGDRAWSLAS